MSDKPKPLSPTSTIETWLRIAVGLLLFLHMATSFFPRLATWGVDYWSEVPAWARLLVLAIGIVAWIPGLCDRWGARLAGINFHRGWGYFGAGAALAVFLILSEHGYSYGDGYSFRSMFAGGRFPVLHDQLAFMPLDLIAHWAIYRGLVLPLGGNIDSAYALTSAIGGVIALAACARIGRTLFPASRPARWFLIGSAFASGMAGMWFGHVEAYTLVGACLLWALSFLIQSTTRRAALAGAWGCGLLAIAFHFLAVALLPALVVGSLPRGMLTRLRGLPKTSQGTLVAALFVATAVGAKVLAMLRPGTLVPFLPNSETTYTAFCIPHLLDMANLLLFCAPIGVVGVLVWGLGSPGGNETADASERRAMTMLLGIGALFLWLFAFWIDPLIGAFRDWDLLGAFGVPFSLWGGVIVADRLLRGGKTPNWLAIAAVALAHTGLAVLGAHNEAQAMVRVDRLVRQDVHYSRDYHRGYRLASWSQLLTEVGHRGDLARDHLWNRIEWEPGDPNGWRNLGSLYWNLSKLDSAAYCFEQGLKLLPDDSLLSSQLGFVAVKLGRWEEARRTLAGLASTHPVSPEDMNLWAFAELQLQHNAHADSLLEESIRQKPVQQEAYYYRGFMFEAKHDTAAALRDYERSISAEGAAEDAFVRCTNLYQAQRKWSEATRIAQRWAEQYPQSPQAFFFLGIALVGTQQFENANAALLRAVALSPNSALAQYYLALSYRHLGDPAKSKDHALRAIALDSLLSLPYLELIYLAADAKDTSAAVAATHQFLRRSPRDSSQPYLKQFMK
jgi:tetratricopeptide (TPR) repeat protein